MKLSKLIQENWIEEGPNYSDEDKRCFLESVANYNSYGKTIYQENQDNYVAIAKKLHEMARVAEYVALNEQDDAFDKITVKRNMNELKKFAHEFGKVAMEGQGLRDRMAGLYEDMGHIYHRYFEVKDMDGDGAPDTMVPKSRDTPKEVDPMMYQEDVPPGKAARRPSRGTTSGATKFAESGSALPIVRPGKIREGSGIKYDRNKFARMVQGDKFLQHAIKTTRNANPEKIFATYVVGDAGMEQRYKRM